MEEKPPLSDAPTWIEQNRPGGTPSNPPPPPVTPPPVITHYPSPPPPPPRRGRGWMVFAIVLLVLLAISALYNLGNYASNVLHGKNINTTARTSGPKLEEVLVEDREAKNKIAVVEINGIISSRVIDQGGFSLVDLIRAQLDRAREDDGVKAVILKVDSPGGEVLASDEINRLLMDFQDKSRKPVVVSMGDLAASGGYYVSAPCRWIVANELTLTGSIGVILHSYNYRGLMDKVGLAPEVYKSGKFKDMLSGEREPDTVPPQEREMLQSLIDETFQKFKSVVANGRKYAHDKNKDKGRTLSEDWADYADGRVLSGSEAYRLGFVDQLGNYQDAVDRAKIIAGISGANLIQYQQRYDISDFLRLFGRADQSQGRVLKIDLGMDTPKLQAGQLYFLSPAFTH